MKPKSLEIFEYFPFFHFSIFPCFSLFSFFILTFFQFSHFSFLSCFENVFFCFCFFFFLLICFFSNFVSSFSFFSFFHFFSLQSSELTPKPEKTSSISSYCKNDDFRCENWIFGPRWTGRGERFGMAHLRVTSAFMFFISCFHVFHFFLKQKCLFSFFFKYVSLQALASELHCRCFLRSRCFRRWAAPVTGCQLRSIRKGDATKKGHAWDRRCCRCCCCGCGCCCCLVRSLMTVYGHMTSAMQ